MKCLIKLEDARISKKTGFHQTRMRPEDVEKTYFDTKYGQFEYLVLSTGLCNPFATFQSLLNEVLRNIDKLCVLYMDDTYFNILKSILKKP